DHTYANFTPGGDLTSTDPLAGLKDLARQVAAAGIRRVQGDVLIDDRLFVKARGSGSGPDLLTPIVVNDNVVDVLITPAAKAGELATVEMRPRTAWMRMDAQVDTGEKDKGTELEINKTGTQGFSVRGHIAAG